MAVLKREPKASNLMIPLKPSVRAMAEKRAAEEGSVAGDLHFPIDRCRLPRLTEATGGKRVSAIK